MEVTPLSSEQVEAFDDSINTFITEKNIPPLDQKFIDMFRRFEGNGTEAYIAAIHPKKVKRSSAHVYASILMKKYGLISSRTKAVNSTVKPRIQGPRSAEEVVSYVKKQYQAGILDEKEVWDKMSFLSRYSASEQVQFNATKEMYEWVSKAKQEVASSSLSEQDVAYLCAEAISTLSPEKYKETLKIIRKKRHELIHKRAEVIDVDEIIAAERRQASQ
jgi:hypothetical protein